MRLPITLALLGFASLIAALSPTALQPRDFDPSNVADDTPWEKLTCKGGGLMASMADPNAVQSEWKGDLKKEMQLWGYKDGFVGASVCDMKNYWDVDATCKNLGLDNRPKAYGGDNICYQFNHFSENAKDENGRTIPKKEQTYTVEGKTYTVTGADIGIAVNPVGGVIFQQYVRSPKNAAKDTWNRPFTDSELPKLRALSDLMWGAWNRENPNVKNINYLWVQGVANARSKRAIARALKQAGKSLEYWPGTTFSMKDDAGKALLGSENGSCFGFFLATHKAELGDLTIEKVTVFRKGGGTPVDPDLLFYVKAGANSGAERRP